MISASFDSAVRRYPASPAVIDGPDEFTYQELAIRADACARHLKAALGLAAGEVVAAFLPNRWEFIAGFFAVARAGAIWLPVNFHWRQRELAWLAKRLRVSAVITEQTGVEAWSGVIPEGRMIRVDDPAVQRAWRMPLKAAEEEAGIPKPKRRFEDEPALYLTTSGSTGRPKAVPRTHRIMLAGAENVQRALGGVAGLRFLSVVPFHHAHGFNNSLLMPLLYGGTTVLMRAFTPAALTEAVWRNRIDVLAASPFIFRLLAHHGVDAEKFASLRICLSSGAPLDRETAMTLKERLGVRVRQLYGSSETGTIAIERDGDPEREGSVGPPLEGVVVKVMGPDGAELPAGEAGEIAVRSPSAVSGYVDEPEENARRFRNGFFLTGDLGRLEPDGSLVITGRIRRWINSAGVKVDPVEVEEAVRRLPQVAECRVTGLRDPRQTELIKAEVVLKPGSSLSRREVVEHCRAHLAEYKIPRVIEFTEVGGMEITGKRPVAWEDGDGLSGS